MKKIISIVLSVLLVLFSFSACASDIPLDFSNTGELSVASDTKEKAAEKKDKDDDGDDEDDEDDEDDDDSEDEEDDEDDDDSENAEVKSLDYKALSSSEKRIYSEIVSQTKKKSSEIKLEDCNEKEMANAMKAAERDYPEYFWLSNGSNYKTEETDGKTVITVEPKLFGVSFKEYLKMSEKTVSAAEKIAEEARKKPKKIDRILFVHDYLVNLITYDNESAKEAGKEKNRFIPAMTAYGALIDKNAVCSGYSAAFKMILNRLGIECGRTEGAGRKNGESHEWNYFSLDGDYYYVDVTWDDPINDGKSKGSNLIYDYFGITTDELLLTHSISKNQSLPECDEDDFDYYKMNGLYFDEYDFDDTAKLIKNGKRKLSFKYSSEKEAKKAYKDLFEKKRIFKIIDGGSGVNYSISNNGLVINISY